MSRPRFPADHDLNEAIVDGACAANPRSSSSARAEEWNGLIVFLPL